MIVVTGMHRSGTSSCAMVMEALGVDFGPHDAFYAADEWNERGYYERTDVIDLNSELLTGSPRTTGTLAALWSQVRYLALPSPASVRRRAAKLEPRVRSLAERLGPIAVKDPRFCLTMGAWQPYVTSTVVVLRHPFEVAQSLHRRQRVPRPLAYRFWDHHARGLLELVPSTAHYVSFDALSDPQGHAGAIEGLIEYLDLDLDVPSALARVQHRFEPRLRHFRNDGQEMLPPRTRELWDALTARVPSRSDA